ncbi:hypothetical protein HDV00_006648 [Rhizophlyctis rosea]|nr:hypothetical protein HDV00_006648 [Rhizophlyctis rosea]
MTAITGKDDSTIFWGDSTGVVHSCQLTSTGPGAVVTFPTYHNSTLSTPTSIIDTLVTNTTHIFATYQYNNASFLSTWSLSTNPPQFIPRPYGSDMSYVGRNVNKILVSSDGKWIFGSNYNTEQVQQWGWNDYWPVRNYSGTAPYSLTAIAGSADGKYFFTGGMNDQIRQFEIGEAE